MNAPTQTCRTSVVGLFFRFVFQNVDGHVAPGSIVR
jgi:hypothetical protein